jgi:tetratricopeptide (TPR) repeat protein
MEVRLRMNCPHCGADTKNAVTICPLCGKTLDRENAFESYIKKGDDAYAADELDKAIISYRKALEYSAGSEDLYLKMGNIYNKKNDKQAASMYMKALAFNFYNDRIHSMLITLYSKYRKLDDLKKWYEQSRGKADPAFIDKYIKIIENVNFFSSQTGDRKPVSKTGGMAEMFFLSMKKYVIMNIVAGIVFFIVALAIVAGIVFKINIAFIFIFSGTFLVVSIVMVFISRRGKSVKKETGKTSLVEIMAEEMAAAKASRNLKVKSQNENQNEPPEL